MCVGNVHDYRMYTCVSVCACLTRIAYLQIYQINKQILTINCLLSQVAISLMSVTFGPLFGLLILAGVRRFTWISWKV